MKITNSVELPGSPSEVFELLLDLEKVAPCMPGSNLIGKDGDAYLGDVKIKVGPLSMTYGGTLRFLEVDHENRRATMKAAAREKNGQGNAEALITASVSTAPSGSLLEVETDLNIRGRAAQFGRGAMVDVSGKIMQQFADNLAALQSGASNPVAANDGIAAAPAAELDMGAVLLPTIAKKVVPAVLLTIVAILVGRKVARR